MQKIISIHSNLLQLPALFVVSFRYFSSGILSTLNVACTIEFMGSSFGCRRCKTREKTQNSKEEIAEEVG
jgi:hypothetical protein